MSGGLSAEETLQSALSTHGHPGHPSPGHHHATIGQIVICLREILCSSKVSARAVAQLSSSAVLIYCADAAELERSSSAECESIARLAATLLDRGADILLGGSCPPALPATLVALLLATTRTMQSHARDLGRVQAASALQRPAYAALAQGIQSFDSPLTPSNNRRGRTGWSMDAVWLGLGIAVAAAAIAAAAVLRPDAFPQIDYPFLEQGTWRNGDTWRTLRDGLVLAGRIMSYMVPSLAVEAWALLPSVSPAARSVVLGTLCMTLLPPLAFLGIGRIQERPGAALRARITAFILHQPDVRAFLRLDRNPTPTPDGDVDLAWLSSRDYDTGES